MPAPGAGVPARTVPPAAWRPLLVIVAVLAAVEVSVGNRYGYHRDELYFVAAGQRPAWGYPDQPPLTPMLAGLAQAVAPGSVAVLRIWAVLAVVAVTLLAGLLARELGGARFAQTLTALATATGAYVVLSGHLLATSTVDLLCWVALTFVVVRALRTGDDRWWLLAGTVLAVGLLNKQLPLFLAAGLVAGLLLTPGTRGVLASRWFWAGAVVAAAAWTPVLVWQATHAWPQLELAAQIRDEYGTPAERGAFFALQLVLFSLGATWLWVLGLVALFRRPAWQRFRVLAWAYVLVMAAIVMTAGQGYYPGGLYPALVAAGAVVVERRYRRRWPIVAAVVLSSLVVLPAMLPVLPTRTLDGSIWSGLGEQQREMVGWPQLVDQVASVYRSLPPDQRATATVYTTNYGEAGAMELFGPSRGLPQVYSGHNGFGLWGPPPQGAEPVVVVWEQGMPPAPLTRCRLAAKITGPVSNEETQDASVYVCAAVVGGWRQAWPRLVHLSA